VLPNDLLLLYTRNLMVDKAMEIQTKTAIRFD